MSDLLLELFSEEIPARMQVQAAADLKRLVTDALVERGLTYEGAGAFATPRRLALHVAGLPARQSDLREQRRGPRVGAPAAAIEGFLKSAGLTSIERARVEPDPKGKGEFYVAVIERKGRDTLELLSEILPAALRNFPWPKSMRWGAASVRTDSLRWVRPLHAIVATFGPETERPDVVPFSIDGVRSGDVTYGHRFLAPGPIVVRRYGDYAQSLEAAKVVLDAARRRAIILNDARDLALAQGLELVEDEALLDEVAGLVEWPVTLMGSFDSNFLTIPAEAIRATIRHNQKCFVLKRPNGELAEKFILVANIAARDDGRAVTAGNERVVRARLSDAKFFWETDLKTSFETMLAKLDAVVFHEKLGTQGERVRRLEALARALAAATGARPDEAARAGRLAKADLVSEMVGEFPELQGLMGGYYAAAQGEPTTIAAAIKEHYRPQGPSDPVPSEPESMAIALADKLDILVGFWSIGEKPTGSKDPYALRRAALGVIRIALENRIHLPLRQAFSQAANLRDGVADVESGRDLLWFFIDRLKVYLRDRGARYDLIEAAVGAEELRTGAEEPAGGSEPPDDLLLILARVEALARFLDTDDGKSLLAGYRRAANIVRIEERKDGAGAFAGRYDAGLAEPAEESTLAKAIAAARLSVSERFAAGDFLGAMEALARLRAPVDAFFDKVTVNADDPAIRANRLRLLDALRRVMHAVADFSKIPG